MEPNNKSNTEVLNRKSPITYSENEISPRKVLHLENDERWHERRKDHQRDHGKNRELGRNLDRSCGSTSHGKRKNPNEEKIENLSEESPQQSSPFPTYGCNTTDPSYVDNKRYKQPKYNLVGSMHSQWGVNPRGGMVMTTNMPVDPSPMASGMDMAQVTNSTMNPYTYMGMSEGAYNMMGNYHFGTMNGQENMVGSVKEIIKLGTCVLYPPNPNIPPTVSPNKPLGCKTVLVKGLPEKATDNTLKEVFECFGAILEIRMKKKFCYIKFANEASANNAVYFSGYNMKIEDKNDLLNTGILHVDFIHDGEDEYSKTPTTSPVVQYSEHEAKILSDKLRNEETFPRAMVVLNYWLDIGECNKKNSAVFHAMFSIINNHVQRLNTEKVECDDKIMQANKVLTDQRKGILKQFNLIEKIFETASLQKVWDQFKKPQRKNIDEWKNKLNERKEAHEAELLKDRIEVEMDVCEDEGEEKENLIEQRNKLEEELSRLQENNDSLRYQLDVAENENIVAKSDSSEELKSKEQYIMKLMEQVSVPPKEVLNAKCSAELNEDNSFMPKKSIDNGNKDNSDLGISMNPLGNNSRDMVVENKACLISWISTFLHVHPLGASIDYIISFLHELDPTIEERDVENLMKSFPAVFKEEYTGIGASLGKKWRCVIFKI